ncbi:MAG: site-specific DNA-methyltransferase, partial [Candidatus Micrarchaeaceae archaeon]
IPEEFYEEIWKNKEQRKEWQDLGFEIPNSKDELKNKKLPIDTKYFLEDFRERLLEKLTENQDLDDILDGLLIKSENWQALNLILNKYKEKVQTIYIDPPYNTGSDEFLYRDTYQHSSWLTMMENRLSLARELMSDDDVIFVNIDDNELEKLKLLMMQSIFGEDKFLETFIWNNTQTPPSLSNISRKNVEYILTFTKHNIQEKLMGRLAEGNDSPLLNRGNPIIELEFSPGTVIFNIPDGVYKRGKRKRIELLDDVCVENGVNKNGFRVRCESKWSQETVNKEIKKGTIFLIKSEDFSIRYLRKTDGSKWITPDKYIDNNFLDKKARVGTNEDSKKELDNLNLNYPSYPKPTSLVFFLCRLKYNSQIILDFFAGSGTTAHAVMKLNKEDGGKRKFILVEMANYFDTIIIPRLKKVAYSFNWKDGKPQDNDGIGTFFKYQILEQYEDTLDNIELNENQQAQDLFKDEYLLKYFLDFETRENPYLLNIEHLKNPFAYKLKVNLSEVGEPEEIIVDIPETFNYLLGIKVRKIKVRDNGRKYLFILGEKENKDIAIVWREYSDNWEEEDFKKDKEFIITEIESWNPNIVYVNWQSVLTTKNWEVRYIEPEFKRLMEIWL